MSRIHASLPAAWMVLWPLLGGCDAASNASPASHPGVLDGYVAMVRGEVDVAGGLIRIFTPQSGRLVTTGVQLGQRVKAGDVLATLESQVLQSALSLTRAEATMARARQQSARLERDSATHALARLLKAQAADAASPQTVEAAQTDLAMKVAQQQVADAEAAAAAVKVSAAEQALVQTRIRAPANGELVQVHAAPFMRVSTDSQTPLFVLLPDAQRIIRAEIDEEFADLVQNSTAAEVVVSGRVEEVIAAKAVHVSSALHRRSPSPDGGEQVDGQVLDCEIEVDAPTLRVGQQVLVRFLRHAP